jgi:hypothetical protein
MGLFVENKPNVTRLNHRNEYYRNYYFDKPLSDGIEIVALIEHVSKKRAAQILMERGFSAFMGDMITLHIENDTAKMEMAEKVKADRFIKAIQSLAKSKGYDLSKII